MKCKREPTEACRLTWSMDLNCKKACKMYLDNLEAQVPLSTDSFDNDEIRLIKAAVNDLELGQRPGLVYKQPEKQEYINQSRIDSNISKIEDELRMLQGYRGTCEARVAANCKESKAMTTIEERSLGDTIGIPDDLIGKACSLASAAHTLVSPTIFLVDKPLNHTIFAFSGSWSVDDWLVQKSFGESIINQKLFPSLRSIGNGKAALVNESFLQRFETVLRTSNLQQEVSNAIAENRQIVFTGHSSGAPTAVLSTIWLMELKQNYYPSLPFCITFGSPLIGDRVFGHSLRREHWSERFIHFLTRRDIVPRILLSPFSSIGQELSGILHFFNPNSPYFRQDMVGKSPEASAFFSKVTRNASYAANHDACLSMGCTNPLLEAVPSFVKLSPYRPFGTYIFSTGDGKLLIVRNPEAVLQVLFYSLQLGPGEEVAEVAHKSLQEHLIYGFDLQENLLRQNVVDLDNIKAEVSFTHNSSDNDEKNLINAALKDLGLRARATISYHAARELEKQRCQNHNRVSSSISKIEEGLRMLQGYKVTCEMRELGYYDSFKYQKEEDDFHANVKRQELAAIWDGVIEILNRYELPDDFERQNVWVDLGTRYRRLVEPIDIANYYRHSMNEDTGPYMIKARPWRYRYNQRWLEHAWNKPDGSCSESCFWAKVEELCSEAHIGKVFEEVKDRIVELERELLRWVTYDEISRDVFLNDSTFVKWWKTLPYQHRTGSCIAALVNGEGRK